VGRALNKKLVFVVLAFVLLVNVLASVQSSKAQAIISDENHIKFYLFTLYSPLNGTYNTPFLDLNLSFTVGMGVKYSLYYLIDGKYVDKIPFTVENATELHVTYRAKAFTQLPKLSEGSHSLTVFIICSGLMRSLPSNNGTVYFTVDSNTSKSFMPQPTVDYTPPKITRMYLQNQTSNQTQTPFYFTIDEAEKIKQVTYSIDKGENKTIPDNALFWSYEGTFNYAFNLTGLKGGFHNITVYAKDNVENSGASETLIFHVDAVETEPFSLTLNIVLVVFFCVVAIVALGVLVKRKHGIVNDISVGGLRESGNYV
jgi:hypothetical protein